MRKLFLTATLAALFPAFATNAFAHRPTTPDQSATVRLDSKKFFDQLQRQGR